MAFPFSVGFAPFQELLDWVAEAPPARARDTHALRFRLLKPQNNTFTHDPHYSGLLFFRPEGVSPSFVGRRPGLDGFGNLLATEGACRSILDPDTAVPPAELVRVFVAFRQQQSGPAQVIASLSFRDVDMLQMPIQTTGEVEFNHVEMTTSGLNMDHPEGWTLMLRRTTVLLSS